MKPAFSISILVMISMSPGMAQEQSPLPLQPINRPVISEEKRCMPFFIAVQYAGTSEKQIIFACKLPDGTIKPDSVPSSRTVLNLVDGMPTYEKTTTADGQTGARFRLSQEEYQKAQACLPKR
jgi:hypothetical protein